jgi:glyoxylase-like metal-dependent hydrolase (beta-lactamase superfamily II)
LIERVQEGVYLIDTMALGVRKFVAAYLLVDEKAALIDTGYASSLGVLLSSIRSAGLEPSMLDYIIVTHVHLDHAGAAGSLIKTAENAKVIAHPRGIKHLIDPTRLVSSVEEIYGQAAVHFGKVEPIPPERISGVEDCAHISLGKLRLRFVYTQGHAPHHLCVYEETNSLLFTGDSVSGTYQGFPVFVPPSVPPSFDHLVLIEDLKRLMMLEPKLLMTPHFGVRQGSKKLFEDEISLLNWWKDFISSEKEKGGDIKSITDAALEALVKKFGVKVKEVPDYVKVSIRLAVEGMLGYLERSATQG